MSRQPDDVIDLTESFTLAHHPEILTGAVIDLDSSSVIIETGRQSAGPVVGDYEVITHRIQNNVTLEGEDEILAGSLPFKLGPYLKATARKRKTTTEAPSTSESKREKNKKGLGDCAICREPLGSKLPLASTICGHIFCSNCIAQSLKFSKYCPTCRHHLKSKTPYHPIFINI